MYVAYWPQRQAKTNKFQNLSSHHHQQQEKQRCINLAHSILIYFPHLLYLIMVSVAQDETACLHQSEDDEDEDADDEFADQEFDNILAEAGEDIQLLHDCAVREAVTYVVCDLVDKVVQQIEPPTNERRIQMYDFFKERLADKSWKTNQRFPKAGSNEELDQLIQRLKFKRRTDASALWRDYKSSNGIIGQIKISTSKEAFASGFDASFAPRFRDDDAAGGSLARVARGFDASSHCGYDASSRRDGDGGFASGFDTSFIAPRLLS
jgi:hypothetical protein